MIMLSIVLQTALARVFDTFDREEGQGFGEYALIFALIVLIAAAAATPLGTAIAAKFTAVAAMLTGGGGGGGA
jgi:Flp pilus assembly pilin Flp